MQIKYNNITFYSISKDVEEWSTPPQTSVSSNIPEWFKKTPMYRNGDTKFIYEGDHNLSVRQCIPLLETFTSGYVMVTPCDIQVRKIGNQDYRYTWGPTLPVPPIVNRPNNEGKILPDIDGYEPLKFNWFPHWSVKTSPGYSCQFIHPINRFDLPFYTLGGIIDTDKWGESGNQPFLLRKNFEGIIPKGTPYLQIIPFKRENWKSVVMDNQDNLHTKNIRMRDLILKGWYKKYAWTNKKYK
jgi:hypothetical protein